ncbi:phosphoethanolamine transferase [Idiomarina xiamenensis]|uniref:Sulfatase n=1 Tax=Idiomarina xiamenensis 10-D-4 TaxID=740709 RepID=K2K649_9GAMM|nr:phosphoethanolamine--lipid A transferase [Idiomarina xiamenensis]EKE82072.1 sulfatase [Idiomarina xiamenensis 10-D-4]
MKHLFFRLLSKIKTPQTYSQRLLFATLYLTLVSNAFFLMKVYSVVDVQGAKSVLFLLTVPLLLFAFSALLLSWLSLVIFIRPVIFVSVVLSSVLLYASVNYGVMFDKNMLQNIFETNSGEASSYFSLSLVVFVLLFGVLPGWWLIRDKHKEPLRRRVKQFVVINVGMAVVIVAIAASFYQNYAATGRNHRELTRYITPFSFYISAFKQLRDQYFYPPLPFKLLDRQPQLINPNNNRLTVLVVGETARAENFSLGGYGRVTNPYTSVLGVKYFSQVSACGTATAVSVPCMFSRLKHDDYNARVAQSQENVLDIIHRAGVEVLWLDNNSSCKGVCERVAQMTIDTDAKQALCDGEFCFDEVLLKPLSEQLSRADANQPQLIVLHLIGSHGPTYYRRYPQAQQQFMPDCPRSDIQNCSAQQLLNSYDNTLVYTDYVLSKIIELLQQSERQQVNLLYLSDHGESLGENGLYLHGFPYQLAPSQQTHVPLIYWSKQLTNSAYSECIDKQLARPLSHDNLYDTLLGMTGVKSRTYQPEQDFLGVCQQA